MRFYFSLGLVCLGLAYLPAQFNPFVAATPAPASEAAHDQRVRPEKAGYFRLADARNLVKQLQCANYVDVGTTDELLLQLPAPDGELHTFRVLRYRMLNDRLQAAFPEIIVAEGWDVAEPYRRVALNWTALGFSASVIGGREGRWYVEPLYHRETELYQSFYTADYPGSSEAGACGYVPDETLLAELAAAGRPETKSVGNCQLQEYDLALACTAEYFNRIANNGMTDPISSADTMAVLSEMIVAVNRVNQVFRQDLAIQLNVINLPVGGNVQLLYAGDTLADPYSNYSGILMLNENQVNLDNVIGSANYDIGHVFSTGGGGIAQLNSPCTASKARGVTGLPNPTGDPFYIDFVAHEMGHQFGATHTFNSTESSCSQRSGPTAFEPGSGTTIQAYAGICGSVANVQRNSDPYYHAASIQQIAAYMELGGGSACATAISTANGEPSVTVPNTTYRIPTNTPFVLEASASDPNGDALTYCWEQFDLGQVVAGMPTGFESNAPLFRSLPPTPETERYFPNLPSVVAGAGSPWEVLPKVARDMNFVVTVRDNGAAGYGCTVQENVLVEVINTGSQYAVVSPNGGESWASGGTETVTWDVAGTDGTDINCTTVEILLSTDGGLTFAESLGTFPNSGSATVPVPSVISTTARIMVRCDGNIFFDVSDQDFRITSTEFVLTGGTTIRDNCSGADPLTGYEVNVETVLGYVGTVNLSLSGLPAGVTGTVSPTSVTFTAGGPTVEVVEISLNNPDAPAVGSYIFQLNGADGASSQSIDLTLEVERDFALTSPTDGQLIPNTQQNPNGSWPLTITYAGATGATQTTALIQGFNPRPLGSGPNGSFNLTLSNIDPGETRTVRVVTNNGLTTCEALVQFGTFIPSGQSLSSPDPTQTICAGRTATDYTIIFQEGDLLAPAMVSVANAPPGLSASVTPATLNDGQSASVVLSGEENLAPGVYTLTLEGEGSDDDLESLDLTLTVLEDFVPLVSPTDNSQFLLDPGGNNVVSVEFEPASGTGPYFYQIEVVLPSGGLETYGSAGGQPLQPNTRYNLNLGTLNNGDQFTISVMATNNGTTIEGCANTFTFRDVLLPVEWLGFTARAEGKTARLNWTVNQDELHAGFAIERRTETATDWTEIAYVNAQVGTHAIAYDFVDPNVRGGETYYYRLRQVDVDGGQDYSVVRSVRFAASAAGLTVYPNPVGDQLNVVLSDAAFGGADAGAKVDYGLYDALGRRVHSGTLPAPTSTLTLGALPVGTYQLVVIGAGDFRETVRLVRR